MTRLPSETDTPAVARRVETAFRAFLRTFGYGRPERVDVFFEHGQWWAAVTWREGRAPEDDESPTFSVVDTRDGFDFERV
jgi:hypothetical protein